jgi:hypothetical protein
MARPPKYESEAEKPVNVSLRLPRDLYDQAQHHVKMRRTTLTELIVEGLHMRLETLTDPRDIVASQDITAMQELEQLIDARIHAILAAQHLPFVEPIREALAQPTPTLQHGKNNTVMQRDLSEGQDVRRRGRPGILRQPILDLLRQHPEGLSALELKVHLKTDKHIGDTLAGMRRAGVVKVEGEGNRRRYFAMDEQPS